MKKIFGLLMAVVFVAGFFAVSAEASQVIATNVTKPYWSTNIGDAFSGNSINTYFNENVTEDNGAVTNDPRNRTSSADGAWTVPIEALGNKYCVNYSADSNGDGVTTPLGNPGPYEKGIRGFFYTTKQSIGPGDIMTIHLDKATWPVSDYHFSVIDSSSVIVQTQNTTLADVAYGRGTGTADLELTFSTQNAVPKDSVLVLTSDAIPYAAISYDYTINPIICYDPDTEPNQFSIRTSGAIHNGNPDNAEFVTGLQGIGNSKWQYELKAFPVVSYISAKEPAKRRYFTGAGMSLGTVRYSSDNTAGTGDINYGSTGVDESRAQLKFCNNGRVMIEDPIPGDAIKDLTLTYDSNKNNQFGVLSSADGIYWDWFDGNSKVDANENFVGKVLDYTYTRSTSDPSVLTISGDDLMSSTNATSDAPNGAAAVGQNIGYCIDAGLFITVSDQSILDSRKWTMDTALTLDSSKLTDPTLVTFEDRTWNNLLTHEWVLNGWQGVTTYMNTDSSWTTFVKIFNDSTQTAEVYADLYGDNNGSKATNVLVGTIPAGQVGIWFAPTLVNDAISQSKPFTSTVFAAKFTVTAPWDRVHAVVIQKVPGGAQRVLPVDVIDNLFGLSVINNAPPSPPSVD